MVTTTATSRTTATTETKPSSNLIRIIAGSLGGVGGALAFCSIAVYLERRYFCVRGRSFRFWGVGKGKRRRAPTVLAERSDGGVAVHPSAHDGLDSVGGCSPAVGK
jgi:hypothetical protein